MSAYGAEQTSSPGRSKGANGDHTSVSSLSDGVPSEIVDAVPDVNVDDTSMSMFTRYVTVVVLFAVNLLNYMDRYTIAGVLDDVKTYYQIHNTQAGFLQAVFIIGYMVFSPIFGYCGDRYNRKYLMLGGIAFWSMVTLASSFVPKGNEYFGVFVALRGLVGVGEASYSTIAPTIISDMFVQSKRSAMLMFFYFAIPVGSGLGYIVGSSVAKLAGQWNWALRVTPGLGVVCCLLILFVSREPPRGMAEHASNIRVTSIWLDIKALLRNKSFMLNTFGFVCVAFVAGALALFAPSFILKAYVLQEETILEATVSLYFGILTASAGFLGILTGSVLAHFVKKRFPSGDALVCAFGLASSAVFLFLAIYILEYSISTAWALIFLGMTLVCLNWSLTADILLYTVIPTRRSAAEALMIFIGHLLGDAGSPYFIGMFSDYLTGRGLSPFKAMQMSLYSCAIVAMIGGGLFLFCSLFIEKDRARADALSHDAPGPQVPNEDESDDAPLIYT